MPAGAYFKQAAADLRGAISELKRDIDNTRHLITEKEQAMRRRKDELNRDKNLKRAANVSDELNTTQRAALLREAQQDVGEITNIEYAFNREREALLQQINQAQADITGLEGQARHYESRQNQ